MLYDPSTHRTAPPVHSVLFPGAIPFTADSICGIITASRKAVMRMKRTRLLLILCLCVLCLSGCVSTSNQSEEAPAVRVVATEAPKAQGSAARIEELMDPFRGSISTVPSDAGSMGYLIPQEIFSQAERDFASYGYTQDGGSLVCAFNTSNTSTYEARGMNTSLVTMSPEEKLEDVTGDGDMDTSLMGDWVHSGGGTYTREARYALQEDLQSGNVEYHTRLNEAFSGEERFSYLIQNGILYFCDATLNHTDFDEDGQAVATSWLITCGKIERNRLNVVEYVSDQAVTMDPNALSTLEPDALLDKPQARQTVTQ